MMINMFNFLYSLYLLVINLFLTITFNIYLTTIRYSKRPLRGPYGQMLEAEMAKPRTTDIALDEGLRPKRKISANLSYSPGSNSNSEPPTPCHHRTTSSPSKLEGLPGPSPELLAELLRGSSERVARAPVHRNVSLYFYSSVFLGFLLCHSRFKRHRSNGPPSIVL